MPTDPRPEFEHRDSIRHNVRGRSGGGGVMAWWAELLISHRNACLSISAVATIFLALWLPSLGFDIRPNATFTSDNQVSRDLERMHDVFGPDDNDLVVMLVGDSLLTPKSLSAMRALHESLDAIPEVESVSSLFDLRKPGRIGPLIPKYFADSFDAAQLLDDLIKHPLAANQMVSADGSVIVMVVRMRGGAMTVSSISGVIESVQEALQEFSDVTGTEAQLAGHPAIRADVLVTLQRAMLVGCTAAVVIAFLVAIAMFRRLAPVLAVVSAPAIGSVWTFGLVAWAGAPVGGLLSALPNLVFVVGLTDAVHLVLEYRRQLRLNRDRETSVTEALIHVGPACVLTSLTTFIGFSSLALSQTQSVQEFGVWSAVGTSLALFAVIFTLPAVLLRLPVSSMIDRRVSEGNLRWWVARFVSPPLRRPALTTFLGVAVTLALIYPALQQQPDIVWTEAIPDDSSSVVAMRTADEKIGGALPAYVMITWPEHEAFPSRRILAAAAETQSILRKTPGFNAEFSILNLLAVAPGSGLTDKARALATTSRSAIKRIINVKERSMLVSAKVPNDGASAMNLRLRDINAELASLAEQFPGFRFNVTGTVVAASQNMNAIILDLARSLAVAAVLIFVVFAIAFRSLRIGCLSAVPNLLPLLVTAAGLSLLGYPLQITSAVTFSLCLGLAVDDTIHVLVRFRSAHRLEPDAKLAMQDALSHVGPALVVTTLILIGGFAGLMISPLPSIRMFSMLSAVILLAALIGDLLLFPAMLVLAHGRAPSCREP